jgi:hypothetical protein
MTQTSNRSIDRHHTFAKRWMITATAIYGLMLIGLLTVVVTGNASRDDSEGAPQTATINDLDEFTVSDARPERSSQRPLSTETTDGLGSAQAPMKSLQAARPAIVPVPEVDEMGDIHLYSGNVSSPSSQASAAPAAQGPDALVENGWDFNAPDSIPGFGSMPQPGDAPLPDDRRLARTNR